MHIQNFLHGMHTYGHLLAGILVILDLFQFLYHDYGGLVGRHGDFPVTNTAKPLVTVQAHTPGLD